MVGMISTFNLDLFALYGVRGVKMETYNKIVKGDCQITNKLGEREKNFHGKLSGVVQPMQVYRS